MRRVLRHLSTFSEGLSLLLCIAVAVFWMRSDSFEDGGEIEHAQGWPEIRVESRMGQVHVSVIPRPAVAWHGFVYSNSIDAMNSRRISLADHYHAREFFGLALVYNEYRAIPALPKWAKDDPEVKARVSASLR